MQVLEGIDIGTEKRNGNTLETYSISANLKAMPRQPKSIETREQASHKGFKPRS